MPEREQQPRPDWAERDREGDLGWIILNAETFWPLAQQGYQAVGRGAVVVDTTTTTIHPGGEGHPFGYYDHDSLQQFTDEDTLRLVRDYEPEEEFVTTLLKAQDRISSYRLRVVGGETESLTEQISQMRQVVASISHRLADLEPQAEAMAHLATALRAEAMADARERLARLRQVAEQLETMGRFAQAQEARAQAERLHRLLGRLERGEGPEVD